MRSTPQQISQDYTSLVGIAYESMNCWDIAVKFYNDILGVSLHNIYSGVTPERSVTKNLIFSNKGDFEETKSPEFGDIIIIRLFGFESHIAIYLGDGLMLHSKMSTGSVIERTEKWAHLIVGYFRIGNTNVKD